MLSEVGERCCGCCACKNVCPSECIIMIKDDEGFSYPYIDKNRCIRCGLCKQVCPVLNEPDMPDYGMTAYYGWHMDENIRLTSSSGGAFTALSNEVIEQGGIVFGAVFCSEKRKVVYGGTDKYDFEDLKRSKYVECDCSDAYDGIKKALDSGRKVLCCAAPCQIAGFKNYFKYEYDNLILCDFICSGVPSPDCFEAYIGLLESKYRSKAVKVNFRAKDKGWLMMTFIVYFANGKQYKSIASYDMYFASFANYKLLNRKSCYTCKFSKRHYSDITIADFWGYAKVPEIKNDDKGISLVIANTEKGSKLIDKAKSRLLLNPLDLSYIEYAIKERKLNRERYDSRNTFFNDVKKRGYKKALKHIAFRYKKMPYALYKMKAKYANRFLSGD